MLTSTKVLIDETMFSLTHKYIRFFS